MTAKKPEYYKKKVSGKVVSDHRIRAERALGKPLPKGSDVHHADGSRDRDSQLVICQDRSYHMLLHRRMRIRAAGGNPNTDVMCKACAKPFPRVTAYVSTGGDKAIQYTCRNCVGRRLRWTNVGVGMEASIN